MLCDVFAPLRLCAFALTTADREWNAEFTRLRWLCVSVPLWFNLIVTVGVGRSGTWDPCDVLVTPSCLRVFVVATMRQCDVR